MKYFLIALIMVMMFTQNTFAWTYKENVDEMDDSVSRYIISRFKDYNDYNSGVIYIGCDNKEVIFTVAVKDTLSPDTKLRVRFDKKETLSFVDPIIDIDSEWEQIIIHQPYYVSKIIQEMINSNIFKVEFSIYGSGREILTFVLTGFANEMKKLAKYCGGVEQFDFTILDRLEKKLKEKSNDFCKRWKERSTDKSLLEIQRNEAARYYKRENCGKK